jgi:hypothetical protein
MSVHRIMVSPRSLDQLGGHGGGRALDARFGSGFSGGDVAR